MKKQEVQIITKSTNGVVNTISRGAIFQPIIKFQGGSIKWFDDNKLKREVTSDAKTDTYIHQDIHM